MGKASSNKKVARAAKAGGSRAKAAGERNLLFPVALAAVIVLGSTLVFVARDQRSSEAQDSPRVNTGAAGVTGDHWHSSYGFYVCDSFADPLPDYLAPQNGGLHTHGDGLIHIHPFSTARAGKNATLENWVLDAGEALGTGGEVTNDELAVPNGDTYIEGESTCEGLDGDPIVQVAVWGSGEDALAGEKPTIITENFEQIGLVKDQQAFTIAFAPEGADIPAPPSTSNLSSVGSELDSGTTTTTAPVAGDPATDTTVAPDTSSTTVAPETTETTVAG